MGETGAVSGKPIDRDSARLFDETGVHETPRTSASERARIASTLALLPPGTRSLLDVGCGRGELLQEATVPFAVGTDLARRGIRHVRRPTVISSMLALPFPDRSFDVVLCAETLEHLDPADLPRATTELRRVASRAIVVTVPYAEDPLAWSHRCPACGVVFHLHGHRSVFTPERLTAYFPGAARYDVRGAWPVRPMSPALLRFRTGTLGLWKYTRHTQCPECGNQVFENHERRLLYRAVDKLNDVLHPRRNRFRWLLLRVDLQTG